MDFDEIFRGSFFFSVQKKVSSADCFAISVQKWFIPFEDSVHRGPKAAQLSVHFSPRQGARLSVSPQEGARGRTEALSLALH